MHTFNDLSEDLRNMGIQKTDVLTVHTSMKAIGAVRNGPDTVLDALTEAVRDGLLTLPAHTWASMSPAHPVYDRRTEPACVGLLPNLFMKRPGVLRSYHPTHSVAAYGRQAEAFIRGEENRTTPCSREGCYGRLYDLDAKILLLGCGLNRNTYLHGVEEWFGITKRLTAETVPLQIRLDDGRLKPCAMHRHFKPNGISVAEYYVKLEKPLRDAGILKAGKFGSAAAMVIKARPAAALFAAYLKQDRDAFLDWRMLPVLKEPVDEKIFD